jgi:hypothetical protein
MLRYIMLYNSGDELIHVIYLIEKQCQVTHSITESPSYIRIKSVCHTFHVIPSATQHVDTIFKLFWFLQYMNANLLVILTKHVLHIYNLFKFKL